MKRAVLAAFIALFGVSLLCGWTPDFSFTRSPLTIQSSYYDYMIGSYNSLPLRTISNSAGGGYFAAYHGSMTYDALRRVYYAYLDQSGFVVGNNNINQTPFREGYPSVAVDPVSGKPLYAWHSDVDNDGFLEVCFTSDAFVAGIPGLFNTIQTVIDNPFTMVYQDSLITTDNEFIWPSLVIGPSPLTGKRRVYLVARNNTRYNNNISENPLFAYADFDEDDIENNVPLMWNYSSIPVLDAWHVDSVNTRRPYMAMACDNSGNLYYCGYHLAYNTDTYESIDEPVLDVFKCDNFGQGTWNYYSGSDILPSWNPPEEPGSTIGYFKGDEGIPYADNQLFWRIMNSSHLNCTIDNDGRIHVPALWGFTNSDGISYEELVFVKEYIFHPATFQFSIHDIYPRRNPADAYNSFFQPWDREAPFGVVDGWTQTDGLWAPNIYRDWNYCLWDHYLDHDPLFFHYNNIKITEANNQGWMAVLWQNSWRSRQFKVYDDPAYAAYNETPEIMIAISPNCGYTWSEPISLNNVEVPEFNGLVPMWAYPADKIIDLGESGGYHYGKLGLLFYDDFFWFANSISMYNHITNPGGNVMFAELQFNIFVSNEDDTQVPVVQVLKPNFPNPFSGETYIGFELSKSSPAELEVFNLKGQKVKTLFTGMAVSGNNSYTWNGCDERGNKLPSGVYFYRLNCGNQTSTRKLILLK